jgi:hypothetical protein
MRPSTPPVASSPRGTWAIALAALVVASSALAAGTRQCSDPAALVVASSAPATGTRQCSDPCLGAARAERKDCITSASGVFLDTVTGCVERDVVCIDACRQERQDCRDATTRGTDLAACALAEDAANLECRVTYPLQPRRLAICTGEARIAGFRCRRDARLAPRTSLKGCRTGFSACADTCGPGGPTGGKGACRAEGRAALQDALGQCKIAYRATASACIDKDLGCVDTCIDGRQTCNAPTQAALDAATDACTATRSDAVAACEAANPQGGAALETCVQSALATAFECRETAINASLPGFASCTGAYAGCLRACPPGATS